MSTRPRQGRPSAQYGRAGFCHSRNVIKGRALPWLLGLYLLISVATLIIWGLRGVYGLTGDEPHYLVMSDAIVRDGTPDVARAYEREFSERRWYPPGLADEGAPLQPPAAHVVFSEAGVFSWHGIGLPALMSIPVALFGELGARLIAIAAGALCVVLTWIAAGNSQFTPRFRIWVTLGVSFAYPTVIASTQIYPDVLAGVLLLTVFVWWMDPHRRAKLSYAIAVSLAIGVCAWLGSRYVVAAVVAGIAVTIGVRHERRQLTAVLSILLVSAIGLMAFNMSTYGSPLGPPTDGALALSSGMAIVLPGLLLDQNQGFLMFNPLLWAAVPGVVLWWRTDWRAALVWCLTFSALWLPAAAHPGLYGLGSFNGRYAWPLAMLAIVPAVMGLSRLGRTSPILLVVALGAGIGFQVYMVVLAWFVGGSTPGSPAGLDLYTRPAGTWLESYSAWWFPIQGAFPALFDPSWAATFAPNWVWIAALAIVGALALVRASIGRLLLAGLIVAVALAAVAGNPGPRQLVDEKSLTLVAGRDQAGFPSIGPRQLMRWGPYTWGVDYQARGSGVVGKWELVRAVGDEVVASGEIRGSEGRIVRTEVSLPFRSMQPREFIYRIGWYGNADMVIMATDVRHGS